MTDAAERLGSAPALVGRTVRLEPLAEAHREALRPVAQDERIWTTSLTNALGSSFDSWFDEALGERGTGRRTPFAVRLADGRLVGSSSYLDIAPAHRRVEIGATWYHPDAWGTAVNPECKLLLLAHAFDAMQVSRVALVTDALNLRSQAAIAKLGALREGVLRSDRITQGGRVRDSVIFSILAPEWPAVRTRLEQRLIAFERHGSGLA
jgi:RimJ/RimL family protein N-acetyltransferase